MIDSSAVSVRQGSRGSVMGVVAVLLGLLVCFAPGRAAALVCGDGELDLLEQCDDGNLLPGDCCSPLCLFEPATVECRPSTGPCDPAEFCTGQSGGCPNDLIRPDADGDAVCDEDDICPAVPDPAQADSDADGIGDACDVCTTVPGVTIDRAKIELARLGDPAGDEKLNIRGSAVIDPMPALNPIKTGLFVQLIDGLGAISVDVTLPPGAIDPVTKSGWKDKSSGRAWRYRGGPTPIGGIQRVIVKADPNDAGVVRFVVLGRNGTYGSPGSSPVTLSLGFRGPGGAPGQCPQILYGEDGVGPRCQYTNAGTRFVCR